MMCFYGKTLGPIFVMFKLYDAVACLTSAEIFSTGLLELILAGWELIDFFSYCAHYFFCHHLPADVSRRVSQLEFWLKRSKRRTQRAIGNSSFAVLMNTNWAVLMMKFGHFHTTIRHSLGCALLYSRHVNFSTIFPTPWACKWSFNPLSGLMPHQSLSCFAMHFLGTLTRPYYSSCINVSRLDDIKLQCFSRRILKFKRNVGTGKNCLSCEKYPQ